jgi:hypothetical protein
LYAGPEYLMHFKYAALICMIYVTFLYGLFIPIMFPITLFGIFNTYITEKLGLIYLYRKPPMFDDSLIRRAFALMEHAPFLMFLMAYWATGDMQLFESAPVEKFFINRAGDPQHSLLP